MAGPIQNCYDRQQECVYHSKQQAWLLKNYGTTVNIGPNVLTHEVLWLESNRRGMGRGVNYFGLDEWLEKTGRRRNDA